MKNTVRALFLSPILLAILLGGSWANSLILVGVALFFMLNHWLLIKLIRELTEFMASKNEEQSTKSLSNRLIMQSMLKLTLLAIMIVTLYFLKQELLVKALILMIFQLIIFVVSIKNISLKDLGFS